MAIAISTESGDFRELVLTDDRWHVLLKRVKWVLKDRSHLNTSEFKLWTADELQALVDDYGYDSVQEAVATVAGPPGRHLSLAL